MIGMGDLSRRRAIGAARAVFATMAAVCRGPCRKGSLPAPRTGGGFHRRINQLMRSLDLSERTPMPATGSLANLALRSSGSAQ